MHTQHFAEFQTWFFFAFFFLYLFCYTKNLTKKLKIFLVTHNANRNRQKEKKFFFFTSPAKKKLFFNILRPTMQKNRGKLKLISEWASECVKKSRRLLACGCVIGLFMYSVGIVITYCECGESKYKDEIFLNSAC